MRARTQACSSSFTRSGVAEASTALNDVDAQLSWRAVRAKLLARGGDIAGAETLAHEAVALAEVTDVLNHRGKVRLDLAEVLRLAGRTE